MTTDPSSHRAQADDFLGDALQMSNLEDLDVGDAVGLGILHGILALHDLIAGLSYEDVAGEEQHHSVEFERYASGGFVPPWPATPLHHDPELDEDDPDTLAETDDTIEQPRFGLTYIDDNGSLLDLRSPREEPADRVRMSGFAAIHRHDDFGYPWGAA